MTNYELNQNQWWNDPDFLKRQQSIGSVFYFLLFLLFLGLKLGHVIDWSWWWITAPLWGGIAIVIVIFIIVFIVGTVISFFK